MAEKRKAEEEQEEAVTLVVEKEGQLPEPSAAQGKTGPRKSAKERKREFRLMKKRRRREMACLEREEMELDRYLKSLAEHVQEQIEVFFASLDYLVWDKELEEWEME
ncbi:PREDICTED: uncharacterized protein LOC105456825 [Wasmannia auropunctata]|uniref:uncharacterized protein LOC105456825 n=1 Tax=Wasmannia auropunctata TaxID=64793 RepID=UPI0005F0A90C|nr:PREDICTED: uncharacterized protein LOC105456825 [Wasmannia auropunctata]XP_011699449.1 PREDICTED: uncharacterized protein LOC105456825 [Wasmannia auropunctata]